jgi:transposase-like protein
MCFVCMDVVSLAVLFVIKSRVVKVLAVLDYMFHGSCRKVSKVLSLALEPISKSSVHYLAKRVSEIRISKEPRYKRCIAVDETKLCVKKSYVYVWSAIDVDSRELLALETSYSRSSLNTPSFLRAALRMCTNKPLVVLDKGPCIDEH